VGVLFTLHYIALRGITWHYVALRGITWHYVALRGITIFPEKIKNTAKNKNKNT
jgi:hypothetical protein